MGPDKAVDPLSILPSEKGLGAYASDETSPTPMAENPTALDQTHRANTIVKDPIMAGSTPSTPTYGEYPSGYGDTLSQTYGRKPSLGHGRVSSYDSSTPILHRPFPSPTVLGHEPEPEPESDSQKDSEKEGEPENESTNEAEKEPETGPDETER